MICVNNYINNIKEFQIFNKVVIMNYLLNIRMVIYNIILKIFITQSDLVDV